MSGRKHTLRAPVGTYTDKQTGKEKTVYRTIGHVVETSTGALMIMVDVIPVNWDGRAFFGELEGVRVVQQPAQQQPPQQQPAQERFDDDIPF